MSLVSCMHHICTHHFCLDSRWPSFAWVTFSRFLQLIQAVFGFQGSEWSSPALWNPPIILLIFLSWQCPFYAFPVKTHEWMMIQHRLSYVVICCISVFFFLMWMYSIPSTNFYLSEARIVSYMIVCFFWHQSRCWSPRKFPLNALLIT